MRTTAIALALLLAAAGGLTAQQPYTLLAPPADTLRLSLDDALGLTDSVNQDLLAVRQQLRRATAQRKEARSGYLPQLNGSITYTRTIETQFSALASGDSSGSVQCAQFTPNPGLPLESRVDSLESAVECLSGSSGSFSFGNGRLPFGQPNTWNFGLGLTQTLFNANLNGRAKSADANQRAAVLQVDQRRAQSLLDVATAYYEATLSDRLLAIAESALVQTERTLKETELSKEVGRSAEFDVLRARVARDNAKTPLLERIVQRDQAYLRLKVLLTIPPDTPLDLSTPLQAVDELPPILQAVQAAYDSAAALRTVVKAAEEQVRLNDGLVQAAKGERIPSLSAGSNYARIGFGSQAFPDLNDFVSDWNVNVAVQVPLFTGGRLLGRQTAAEASRDESTIRLKQVQLNTVRDNRLAVELLEAARAALEGTTQTVEQAQRAYDIGELRYREGISTQTDLTQARLQLQQAEANRAQALRTLQIARVRVALLGALPLGTGDAALALLGVGGTTTVNTTIGAGR